MHYYFKMLLFSLLCDVSYVWRVSFGPAIHNRILSNVYGVMIWEHRGAEDGGVSLL